MHKDYIAYSEYEGICKKEAVIQEDKQKELIGVLHELGVMLHFPDKCLPDMEVLNPEWATEGIYKIINSRKLKECKGLLPGNRLEYVLNIERLEDRGRKPKKYSKDEQRYIVELMNKFELCYELDDGTILVPDLLTEQEPREGLPKEPNSRFYFEYDFMPTVVMPRFIVQRHKDIDAKMCWRTGAVLKDKSFGAVAVVRQDKNRRRIYVEVTGSQARDYFATIRKTITDINKSFEKLPFTEWVPLPDEQAHAVKYLDLIGHEINKRPEKFVGELGKGYPVVELLGSIESPKETSRIVEEIKRGEKRYYDFRGANIPGGVLMDQAKKSRIKIDGDAIGSAVGEGASAITGDIKVIKHNIDKSGGLDDDTKAKLKQACDKLEELKLLQENIRDVAEDIEKLRIELMKPPAEQQQRRKRIKHLFDRINIVAQPVAAILNTIASVAQLMK